MMESDYYELMLNTRAINYEIKWNSAKPIVTLRVDFNGKEMLTEYSFDSQTKEICNGQIEFALKHLTTTMLAYIKGVQNGTIDPTLFFAK